MAIYALSDGGNDHVLIGSTLNLSDNVSVLWRMIGNDTILAWDSQETSNRLWGVNNNNNTLYGKVSTSVNRVRVRAFNNNMDLDWTDASFSFADDHTFELIQDGVDTKLEVDGTPIATVVALQQIRMSRVFGNIGGQYTVVAINKLFIADADTSANDRQFNSESSGGTGNFWVDDIGTDLALTNFATNGDQWLDTGGGGDLTIDPTSIPSAESFGTPEIILSTQILSATSIASEESFGTPVIIPGSTIVAPSSIPSAESFGNPIILSATVISPVSIASEESFGTPSLSFDQIVSPVSIPSEESFGNPTIGDGTEVEVPSGIIISMIRGLITPMCITVSKLINNFRTVKWLY